MPKTRPSDGDSNWGVTLNNHLAQTLNENGGINTATSDPTLTSGDEGYTYINTTTGEMRQWGGSSWEVLMNNVDTTEASGLDFDNSTNGFTADTIQGAIEENKTSLENLGAADIDYDNTASGLTADNIKSAIDEVDTKVNSGNRYFIATALDGSPTDASDGGQTGVIAIGDGANISSFTSSGAIAIGTDASIGGNGTDGIAIGKDAIGVTYGTAVGAGSFANGTGSSVLGWQAISNGSLSVQLGPGTNNASDTLQFRDVRLANAQGLFTSYTTPSNYTPTDTDNVTSHLEAIDTALATSNGSARYNNISGSFDLLATDTPQQFFVSNTANPIVNLPATPNTEGYFVITNLSPVHNVRMMGSGIDHFLPGKFFSDRENFMTFVWNGSGWVIGYESFVHIAHNVVNGANPAYAPGTNSLAVGSNTEVRGDNSTALGYQADISAGVSNAVQLGQGVNSTSNSLQFRGIRVVGPNGLYSGRSATNYTAANDSVNAHLSGIDTALASAGGGGEDYITVNSTGTAPVANGADSIAIGEGASTAFNFSVAIGPATTTTGNVSTGAIAIGEACTSTNSGIALGRSSTSSGVNSLAIGSLANAGDSAVQIGQGTNNVPNTVKFRNNTFANDTSIQVTTQSTGSAPSSTPPAGTLIFDTSTFTMYAYDGSTWRSASFT